MKFRTYFQRKLINATVVLPIGFGLIALEKALSPQGSFTLQIATFIGTGVLFIYRYRAKCPSCRKEITFLWHRHDAHFFQLPNDVHYCPYCGNTLDCEVDEATGAISRSVSQ